MHTTILQKIDAYLESNQDSSHRWHLGASIIGRNCRRQLWYTFRWATEVKHPGRILRLFNRGNQEEPRFVELLEPFMRIWSYDPQTGEQFRIKGCGGHFGGSLDGMGYSFEDIYTTQNSLHIPKDVYFVLEYKTHGEKSFKKLVQYGVFEAKHEHFVQMQIYMYKTELKYGLYVAVNKNTDELYFEIVVLDPSVAERYELRAEDIIFCSEPPTRISHTPSWWECKFCDHHNICHHTQFPPVNCRTCASSTPERDGTWSCTRNQPQIETSQQTGCNFHMYNPRLIKDCQVIDVYSPEKVLLQFSFQGVDVQVIHGLEKEAVKSEQLRCDYGPTKKKQ